MIRKIVLCWVVVSIPYMAQSASINAGNQTPISLPSAKGQSGHPKANRLSLRLYAGESINSSQLSTSCLALNSVAVDMSPLGWHVSIAAWDTQVGLESFDSSSITYNFSGTISNQCDYDVKGYVHALAATSSEWWGIAHTPVMITFPAHKTCSAVINDAEFGSLNAGDTGKTAQITINKSGSGAGTVTFTGADLKSDGNLQLGGSSTIQVRPTDDSFVDATTGHWISGAAVNTIPLTATVGAKTASGTYTSNLTATLTCE